MLAEKSNHFRKSIADVDFVRLNYPFVAGDITDQGALFFLNLPRSLQLVWIELLAEQITLTQRRSVLQL